MFFQSHRGVYDPLGSNDQIQSWPYAQTVPPPDGPAARVNLWLRGGLRPASKKAKSIEPESAVSGHLDVAGDQPGPDRGWGRVDALALASVPAAGCDP